MTQPARIFDLWRRLYSRFLIEPFPADGDGPAVATTIVPVTSADELLRSPEMQTLTTEAPAGDNTNFMLLTVPAGERWHAQIVNITRTSGDNTFSRVVVRDASANDTMAFTIFSSATQVTLEFHADMKLEEGDQIGVLTDGAGVAVSNIRAQLWCEIEDAF